MDIKEIINNLPIKYEPTNHWEIKEGKKPIHSTKVKRLIDLDELLKLIEDGNNQEI